MNARRLIEDGTTRSKVYPSPILPCPAISRDPNYDRTEGDIVLSAVEAFVDRFISYPNKESKVSHVLWIAHSHLMTVWDSTPRIAFLSPEPGSGKTRALEVSELLVPRPVEAINATPAYLFRKVSDPDGAPTILFDEIDTLFGPRAKDNEEVRGVLNAGHRRGAKAGRCVIKGHTVVTEEFPAYCAVAIAGLGKLPDSILTRSIVIRMRRRGPNEHIEPFRRRIHAAEGHAICARLSSWAASIAPNLEDTRPEMPIGVEDRAADVWEALVTVADAAGGEWPTRARQAAVRLVRAASDSEPSIGIRLLSDLRSIFGDKKHMRTDNILTTLHQVSESPWKEFHGKPIDARQLAQALNPYGIKSKTLRDGNETVKGYTSESMVDAWTRYLPRPSDRRVIEADPCVSNDCADASVTRVTDVTEFREYDSRIARNAVNPITESARPTGGDGHDA